MELFLDHKRAFGSLFSDRNWKWKVLLGGFLLINPFLLALAPSYFSGQGPSWVEPAFCAVLAFNVLSFWFPLGFTYEVLRRARFGLGSQLPDWSASVLGRFAYEGSVKLVLAVFTLILPVGGWVGLMWLLLVRLLGLPVSLLSMFAQPAFLFVIPFCGVACCRWLDGASVLNCALNYAENWRLFRRRAPEYLLASFFLMGLNAVTTAFYYSIPFGAVFGLCLVDLWFGPIYANSVDHSNT